MQKTTLLGAIALILALGGVIFYAATRPATGTLPALALPEGGYSEHAAYYDIVANYATTTPLRTSVSAPADRAAVALMQRFVSDTIVQFKTDGKFDRLTPTDVQVMGFDKGRKETLQIAYLISSSAHTVSYIFTIYEDTLGAHGNAFFHTFTFDTTTGAPLSLTDVFLPGADYLGTLSVLSRAKLPDLIDAPVNASMLAEGTQPADKNFAAYFLDNRDFVVLFAPYAVAPYSAGPQTLRIPLSDLASILKPEYR